MDAKIAAHPLGSERVCEAHRLIEEYGHDRGRVSSGLAQRGLPSLRELGSLQVRHTLSWWWLHRRRNRLAWRLARLRR
ncbi:hypothetical protein D4740_08620 [Actinomyces sp. 2119]|nr:hypothetical protein D4740_08620 [Actinomyces sp. 2119]